MKVQRTRTTLPASPTISTPVNFTQVPAPPLRPQAAAEEQRRAVANFVARPSLFPAISFLLRDCLRPLASGCCPCCSKRLLPVQPQQAQRVPKGGWWVHSF